MRSVLSTIAGFRMDQTCSTADCPEPAGELCDTGRFGTVRVVARNCPLYRPPTSDNIYAMLNKP
jgi:hypothetical protein